VPGLLAAYPVESTLIAHIPVERIDDFITLAEDRMKKKVLGAQEALEGGVRRVIFADGRVEQPVQRALAGAGTTVGQPVPVQSQ